MSNMKLMAVDLAKNIFQVCGLNEHNELNNRQADSDPLVF